MKKLFSITIFIFKIGIALSQEKNDSKFCLQELKKIEKLQDNFFSKIDENRCSLILFQKNGQIKELIILKSENEGVSLHEINVTYFFSEVSQVKGFSSNNAQILNFLEKEIRQYDLTLKNYILDAFSNIRKKQPLDSFEFPLYVVTTDFESELVLKKISLSENKVVLNLSFFIKL